MAKGRKKKDLNVNIDTPNTDVKLTRKDGKTTVDVDGKIVDVHYEKSEQGKTLDIKVESNAVLQTIGKVLSRVISKKRG